MRYEQSTNDTGWPPEMRMATCRIDTHLAELVFLRSTWSLAVDLPEASPRPALARSEILDPVAASEAWTQSWASALAWSVSAALLGAENGNDHEKLDRFRQLGPPPSWKTQAGITLDAAAFDAWMRSWNAPRTFPLKDDPIKSIVPALQESARRGLQTIFVLPLEGEYARRVSPSALAVSLRTRVTRTELERALRAFSRRSGPDRFAAW